MNEAFKLENIVAYAESNQLVLVDNGNILSGQIDAKFWKYALFSGFAAFDIKHLLLVVNSDRLTMVGVTITGAFSDSIVHIPTDVVQSFQFKKGLMQSTISFVANSEKYIIKIPNVIAVARWQKGNIKYLLDQQFFGLM